VRNDQDDAQSDADPPAAQRFIGTNPKTVVVHESGYGTRVRPASLLLLTIALVAGCGGGGNGERLTRDQYAAKADAICSKYKQKTDTLERPSDLAGLAKIADQTLSILHDARNDFRKLRPPASEQATADAWLDEFDLLIQDVEQLRDKAKASDVGGVQQIARKSLEHNQRANELGSQLGMTVCSKD